jgi:hypothetical protein
MEASSVRLKSCCSAEKQLDGGLDENRCWIEDSSPSIPGSIAQSAGALYSECEELAAVDVDEDAPRL